MKRNELKTTEDFINRSKEIYKDLFEYDKTEFIDLETPIILKCKRCGNYFEIKKCKITLLDKTRVNALEIVGVKPEYQFIYNNLKIINKGNNIL